MMPRIRQGSTVPRLLPLACGLCLFYLRLFPALSQSSGITTYCNPLDIDYRYNWEQAKRNISYRSAADPVILYHEGHYNILWGSHPDKLRQTYQVFADRPTSLEVRALTVGQDYYFAIEAFNENGVSGESKVVFC